MAILLTLLHVLVCAVLMVVILLQQGKGAEIGASFGGGSSNTLFGGRGSGNVLTKVTAIAGAVFMITSLALAKNPAHLVGSSVVTETSSKKEAPAVPGGMPGGAPAKPTVPAQPISK